MTLQAARLARLGGVCKGRGFTSSKARETMKSTRAGAVRAPRKGFSNKKLLTVTAVALLVLLAAAGTLTEAGKAQAISTTSAPALVGRSNVAFFGSEQNNVALFDADWRFHRGGAQGAEAPDFDDSKWRKLDLPHDWSIEDLPGTRSPFDPDAISQVSGGFTTGGTGWYRKTFNVPAEAKGKRIVIQCDGVYMDADVWLNGQQLGTHPYGYTSFWYDLTDKVKFGGANTLAVKVQNEGENSRWYSGSGIYRHVWLSLLDPVHISQWGSGFVTSELNPGLARIRIQTPVANSSDQPVQVGLVTRILDANSNEVATARSDRTIEPGQESDFLQTVEVQSPRLWNLDNPELYTGLSELYRGQQLTD